MSEPSSRLSNLLRNLCDMFEHAERRANAMVVEPDMIGLFVPALREGLATVIALEAAARERNELLAIARDLELVGEEDTPRPSAEVIAFVTREQREAEASVASGLVRLDRLRKRGGEVVPLPIIARPIPSHPDTGGAT